MLKLHLATFPSFATCSLVTGQAWSKPHENEDTIMIIELLMDNPAMYLDELQQELHQSTGTWTSISTIFVLSVVLDSLEKVK